jgi:3-phenylpropionate/trans-cinnamate dioxygenase ferredoxin reductase subunit
VADRSVEVVIVGAGAAGVACATELRSLGFGGSVLLAGREPDSPYDRPAASKGYLAGTLSRADVELEVPGDVELLTRASVMKADVEAREVKLASGELVAWTRGLVIATGANVRRLRVDGAQLEGIHYLRALGNADAIRADVAEAESVVLIGGSFIACEVAATLTALGKRCTLVMLEPAPMTDGFGPQVGAWVAVQLSARGVELICGDGLERFEGSDAERVAAVVTASGRRIPADAVVMGTGAIPDVMLARAAGLALGETGGVACSPALETSAPGVWAAGDVCEFGGRRIEHWEVAQAQGRHVARSLVSGQSAPFVEVPYFWTDLGDWATLEYVGSAAGGWDAEVVSGSLEEGAFSVRYSRGGELVAALACDRPDDLEAARRELASAAG